MKFLNGLFIFVLFNLIFTTNLYSQHYKAVDSVVDNFPENIVSPDKLVELINKNFSKPDQKARAVFRWVTTNIKFDVGLSTLLNAKSVNAFSYTSAREKEIKDRKFKAELIRSAMLTRTAVCHGYAALVESLLLKSGLESKIIFGDLKSDPSQIGELPNELNHAWNVVKIDSNWQFIDATLGAGFVSGKTSSFKKYYNDSYFFTSPKRFALNHFPADEKWLLVTKSKKEFANQPLYFGTYFEKDYQMIKPISGLYSSATNDNFTFAIKGLDEFDTVQYSFSDDNRRIYLDQKNNFKEFVIPLKNKKNNYFSIFVNGKIITMYKIIE